MIKKLKKLIQKNVVKLSLSLANVEKNALGQKTETLADDVNYVRRNTQGQLADSLIQGEVSEEVRNLRWRTYKILKESSGHITEIIGYDEDGYPITRTYTKNKTKELENIKLDEYDTYPLEMCVNNDEITLSVSDTLSNNCIEEKEENLHTKSGTTTLGIISGDKYYSTYKSKRHIIVERKFVPKFDIEAYTKKLTVRYIDNDTRLLEFYVSKYPKDYNKTSVFFIKEIKKAIKNPMLVNMLDISTVSFITDGAVGVDDFYFYKYTDLLFDKIIEFDGNYVIKFKAKVEINGEDIFEKYRQKELDKKYEKKEKK